MLAGLEIPDPQGLVVRARHGAAAIGRYCDGIDRVRMAFDRAQRLAALQVPDPQRSVVRARYGSAAVGRYRHGSDPVGMPFERAQ